MKRIISMGIRLHVFPDVPGSGKTLITKHCFTNKQGKNELLIENTSTATRLGGSATSLHNAFRIPMTGGLTIHLQCSRLQLMSVASATLAPQKSRHHEMAWPEESMRQAHSPQFPSLLISIRDVLPTQQ